MKKNWYPILISLMIMAYAWVRMDQVLGYKEPKIYPDTARYLEIATHPINDIDFWTGGYPVVVPAIQRSFDRNPQSIAWFQTFFSMMAWVTLAIVVSKLISKKWLKTLILFIILVFSLDSAILLWDWVILSESISGSLLVFYIAAWLLFLRESKWRWVPVILVIGIGTLWTFTRDTNALINLSIAALILLFVLVKKEWRYLIFVAIFVSAYFVSAHFAEIGGRWIGPNLSVIGTRILPDPWGLAFYQSHGMPISEALLAFTGKKAGPVNEGFSDDPELDSFNQWHLENGKIVYVKYLLASPLRTFLAPFKNASTLMDTDQIIYFKPKGFEPILKSPLDGLLFFDFWNRSVAILSLFVFTFGIILGIKFHHKMWATPFAMLLLLYPHAFLIWHASGLDTARHAYQLRLHFNLTFILFSILIVETIFEKHFSNVKNYLVNHIHLFYGFRYGMITLGVVLTILSILFDLIQPGAMKVSIGYAQTTGILIGLALVGLGLWLNHQKTKRK